MTIRRGNNIIAGSGPVDQIYDSTSTNAQSGIAVADAISTKADDNSVVHLSGAETITGEKTFDTQIFRSAALSGSGDTSVRMIDENGKGQTRIISYYTSEGRIVHRVHAKNDTSNKYAQIDAMIGDDGNAIFRTSTDGTESFTTNSIVTSNTRTLAAKEIKIGFNTGLKIATAEISATAAGDVTFSYGITFSASPVVIVTRRSSATTTTAIDTWVRGDTGTSNSKVYFSNSGTAMCIAIGY